MVVAIGLAAVAVVASVVVLAMGKGGELAETHPDHPPLTLPGSDRITGTDVALLRMPASLWGYHMGVTDEALDRLAHVVTERDTRIAVLEQQVARLRQRLGDDDGLGAGSVAEREEQARWTAAQEPRNSWDQPGSLPSWSPGEMLPAQEHGPHDSYDAYDAYEPYGAHNSRGPFDARDPYESQEIHESQEPRTAYDRHAGPQDGSESDDQRRDR